MSVRYTSRQNKERHCSRVSECTSSGADELLLQLQQRGMSSQASASVRASIKRELSTASTVQHTDTRRRSGSKFERGIHRSTISPASGRLRLAAFLPFIQRLCQLVAPRSLRCVDASQQQNGKKKASAAGDEVCTFTPEDVCCWPRQSSRHRFGRPTFSKQADKEVEHNAKSSFEKEVKDTGSTFQAGGSEQTHDETSAAVTTPIRTDVAGFSRRRKQDNVFRDATSLICNIRGSLVT